MTARGKAERRTGTGGEPLVRFAPEERFRADVRAAWLAHSDLLARLVPGADLQHVGSTAVAGSLTKGDLDIQVRVAAEAFDEAERALASAYDRNTGSSHVPGAFAAFEARTPGPVSVGVQLTTMDGEFDTFWRFREVLLRRSDLREAYDALKRGFDGQSMAAYRAAKNVFFDRLRAEPEFAAARLPGAATPPGS